MLLIASALKRDLGLPTCLASLLVTAIIVPRRRSNPLQLISQISWSVLPLVAALFVIVEAVKSAGALQVLNHALLGLAQWPAAVSAFAAGGVLGFGANLVNNLPLGLLAGTTLQGAPFNAVVAKAVLIGIDLGPNLSVTGSLATILWLIAIRREGIVVSGWQFLKAGMIIMPLSLALTIAVALLVGGK